MQVLAGRGEIRCRQRVDQRWCAALDQAPPFLIPEEERFSGFLEGQQRAAKISAEDVVVQLLARSDLVSGGNVLVEPVVGVEDGVAIEFPQAAVILLAAALERQRDG